MSNYIIQGEWKSDGIKFYGQWFTRFEAVLPTVQEPKDMNEKRKRTIVTIYLPEDLAGKGTPIEDEEYRELKEVDLPPGTIIMRQVPYSIIVGDPSSLPRSPLLCDEDLAVEGRSIKTLALPAS